MKFLNADARRELKKPWGILCVLLITFSFIFSVIGLLANIGMIGQPFAGFRSEPTLTVSAVNEPYWSGPQAGLKTYDRILKMNGETVTTPEQFQDIIRNSTVGETIDYVIQHKGEDATQNLSIEVQRFSGMDFTRSFLLFYLIGFLHILVGSIAYLIRPGDAAARAHLFMTLAIGVTTNLNSDYDTSMWFTRVWLSTVTLTGAACLHLALYFPRKKKFLEKRPWLISIPYMISAVLLVSWQYAFRHLGYAGYAAQNHVDLFDLHFMLYDLSLAWSLVVGFLGLIGLIIHSLVKAESQVIKNQAKVALLGAVVAYLPMTVFFVILDQTLHIPVIPAVATFCWLLFVVFPLAIAYAIIKHKMFDIDFVLKQSMTYTSLLALLGALYVGLAAGLQNLLTPIMTNNSELTAYMLTTGVTILLFEPLKLNIRGFIDRKFFRTQYDFRAALSEFIDAARSTINIDELTPKLAEVVEKTIHPKHVLLFLKNPDTNSLKQAYSHGLNIKIKKEIPMDDAVLMSALGLLKGKKNLTSRLTGVLNPNAGKDGPIPSPIPFLLAKRITSELPDLKETEAIRNSLTLPLTVRSSDINGESKEEIIGLLTLGEKRSEMEYTVEDRQLFQSIGQQLALTLHSSQLADEVAEKEAIKKTLMKARVIQRSMLPGEELELSGFEMTGFSESADETGGDYYDWYRLENGHFVMGIGDVTGHGIDAAMIVGMAKSCLSNQIELKPEVEDTMAALNRTIHQITRQTDRRNRKLMSFVYNYFDPEKMTCHMASAGHWFPYHYKAATGELTNYPEFKGTFPLGQRPPEKFKCSANEVSLAPGDVLLYFTDGLHEAENPNGQAYEFERVEQMLHWNHMLSAMEIKERLQEDWERHIDGHGMDDDMTLVVVKVQ